MQTGGENVRCREQAGSGRPTVATTQRSYARGLKERPPLANPQMDGSAYAKASPRFFRLLSSGIGLAYRTQLLGGVLVNSTLKIQTPSAITLIEKIKAELKKRTELKAKRMLLKVPKRQAKR
jgi:hypothetical protein